VFARVVFAVVGTLTFVGTITLWGDWPPSIGQHLLPISGLFWMLCLAHVLGACKKLMLGCATAYLLVVAPLAYLGAVTQHTHVIYASICWFAITVVGAVLLVHAWRHRRSDLAWRIVAFLLFALTVDTVRYAIVLLVRWLVGRRC
jgi:hypothetical protein